MLIKINSFPRKRDMLTRKGRRAQRFPCSDGQGRKKEKKTSATQTRNSDRINSIAKKGVVESPFSSSYADVLRSMSGSKLLRRKTDVSRTRKMVINHFIKEKRKVTRGVISSMTSFLLLRPSQRQRHETRRKDYEASKKGEQEIIKSARSFHRSGSLLQQLRLPVLDEL